MDTRIIQRMTADEYINKELLYSCHNYKPIPVVLSKGKGIFVWDVDNKKYYDFLSGYSAVNQGHCHPKIIKTLIEQCQKLTLTSRAFHTDALADYAEYITKLFNYDKVLTMNTGVEAGETAVKLARRWGYVKKGIPKNEAKVVFANNNFWGRSIAAISSSTDPLSYKNFGPFTPGFELIEYDNLEQLEAILKKDDNICAFMVEPIQGEAGIIIPADGYLKNAKMLCEKYNVLFIADEIQTGLGRTGKLLASNYDNIQPDILTLGKALSGGTMPISAVLANDNIMMNIAPGEHGSTYGGNPLACKIATTALQVLLDERMIENAFQLGNDFRNKLQHIQSPIIKDIRGKGLMNAIEVVPQANYPEGIAMEMCLKMLKKGLLAKPTHENTIRLAPPLIIDQVNIDKAINIITEVVEDISN